VVIAPLPLQYGLQPFPGYRLLKLRGRGAFGEVWKAETASGQTVALKFIPCQDPLTIAKEIRSLQTIGELRHPNLIRIDRIWNYQNYIVIAMELAEASLLDVLEVYQTEFGIPIVPDYLCHLLRQAARALDFLNMRRHFLDGKWVGIQHGDVKPSNILLFGDTVKLCDFTLAAPITSPLTSHRRAGTPAYAAPEVFQALLSERTDQYALAVSYYQLRTGQLPFPDTPATFERHYRRPEPDLGMLPSPERPLLARALSPVPAKRWPSCKELLAELTKVVA
jgi:serine/threonine protein kinase